MPNAARAIFPLIVVVLLVYLASQTLLSNSSGDERIAYGDLIGRVEDSPESIANVLFIPKGQAIRITLADGSTLKSHYPTDASQLDFQHRLESAHIHFDSKGAGSSVWWSILTYLLPFVLFFGFWIFLTRQVQEKRRREESVAPFEPAES
jgi:cell division protease FtsH